MYTHIQTQTRKDHKRELSKQELFKDTCFFLGQVQLDALKY